MNRVPSQGKPYVSAITALWLCVIAQKRRAPRGHTARSAATSAAMSAGNGA